MTKPVIAVELPEVVVTGKAGGSGDAPGLPSGLFGSGFPNASRTGGTSASDGGGVNHGGGGSGGKTSPSPPTKNNGGTPFDKPGAADMGVRVNISSTLHLSIKWDGKGNIVLTSFHTTGLNISTISDLKIVPGSVISAANALAFDISFKEILGTSVSVGPVSLDTSINTDEFATVYYFYSPARPAAIQFHKY